MFSNAWPGHFFPLGSSFRVPFSRTLPGILMKPVDQSLIQHTVGIKPHQTSRAYLKDVLKAMRKSCHPVQHSFLTSNSYVNVCAVVHSFSVYFTLLPFLTRCQCFACAFPFRNIWEICLCVVTWQAVVRAILPFCWNSLPSTQHLFTNCQPFVLRVARCNFPHFHIDRFFFISQKYSTALHCYYHCSQQQWKDCYLEAAATYCKVLPGH